ncbi:MAG: alpha/beta fold hydrolase, partial [Bacteroidota bacterium]
LDGTGLLFAPLLDVLPSWVVPVVISYPTDRVLDYDQLLELLKKRIPGDGRYILLGESFSGPVAIRLAAERPEQLIGLILVATFVSSPIPAIFGRLRWLFANRLLFAIDPPRGVVRYLLLDRTAPPKLVSLVIGAIRDVGAAVLAARLRLVLRVDVTEAMSRCVIPVLYIMAARDRIVREDAVMKLMGCRPGISLARVSAPHLLLQREPAICGEIIEEFLHRVVPDAPGADRER